MTDIPRTFTITIAWIGGPDGDAVTCVADGHSLFAAALTIARHHARSYHSPKAVRFVRSDTFAGLPPPMWTVTGDLRRQRR